MKTIVTLLMLFTLFSLNAFAQDSAQWSLPDGAKARLGKGSVSDIQYSPDGTLLAVGGSLGIWLYDTHTGAEVALLPEDTGRINSVSFSPDGGTLASNGWDGVVRFWDVSTGELIRTFEGHTGEVISFSPDGGTLISGSGMAILWDVAPFLPIIRVNADVNGDGVVNILDLVIVAGALGHTGQIGADVNGDGVVNILDLVTVAGALGNTGAAPATHPQALSMLTAGDVQSWLTQAQRLSLTDLRLQRGVRFLEGLLAALTPKATILLPNYPNPFNPETWIPYHLADAADVQITIYDTKGVLVRELDLGYQPARYYADRSKAAYWDGRNANGESVASGIYFYQLRAGDYSATRRMVILK